MKIDYQSTLERLNAEARDVRFKARDILLTALSDIRKQGMSEVKPDVFPLVTFHKQNGLIDKGILQSFNFADEGYGIFCKVLDTNNISWNAPLNRVVFACVEDELGTVKPLLKFIDEKEGE